MTLDELTTPFERRRVIEYGKDGNKAIRRWYEVQQVDGALYRTRDFPDWLGVPQSKLCVFFEGAKDGLRWQWIKQPGSYAVETVKRAAERDRVDSLPAMMEDLESRMGSGKFVGNAEIEFIRQFDAAAADRLAEYRRGYYSRIEERERRERLERQAGEDAEKARRQAELEAAKAAYLGWADGMPPMRFGRARAVLEKTVRHKGRTMPARDFVVSLVKDGWKPARLEGGPKAEHRLARDGLSYAVNKTEYDFAVYLSEHAEVLDRG